MVPFGQRRTIGSVEIHRGRTCPGMGWCLQQIKIQWSEKKRKEEAPARNGDTSHIGTDGEESWALGEYSRQVGPRPKVRLRIITNGIVFSQSKTLPQAVTEYTRRYGRPPPRGFDQWWQFCKRNNVKIVDNVSKASRTLLAEPDWRSDFVFSTTRSTATSNYILLSHQICSGNVSIFSRRLLTRRELSRYF